jgi:hypothetical protein
MTEDSKKLQKKMTKEGGPGGHKVYHRVYGMDLDLETALGHWFILHFCTQNGICI